jgi:hypothetical protein
MKTASPHLPPDPDDLNDHRAEWASAALREFQRTTNDVNEDALAGLLAGLMHWCDRHGTDFEHELTRARSMYGNETNEGKK